MFRTARGARMSCTFATPRIFEDNSLRYFSQVLCRLKVAHKAVKIPNFTRSPRLESSYARHMTMRRPAISVSFCNGIAYFMCCPLALRIPPVGCTVLFLAVVCYSIIASVISVRMRTVLVFYAFLATSVLVLICVILAFTKFDFTGWLLYLIAFSLVFIILVMCVCVATMVMGIYIKPLHIAILLIGTIINCLTIEILEFSIPELIDLMISLIYEIETKNYMRPTGHTPRTARNVDGGSLTVLPRRLHTVSQIDLITKLFVVRHAVKYTDDQNKSILKSDNIEETNSLIDLDEHKISLDNDAKSLIQLNKKGIDTTTLANQEANEITEEHADHVDVRSFPEISEYFCGRSNIESHAIREHGNSNKCNDKSESYVLNYSIENYVETHEDIISNEINNGNPNGETNYLAVSVIDFSTERNMGPGDIQPSIIRSRDAKSRILSTILSGAGFCPDVMRTPPISTIVVLMTIASYSILADYLTVKWNTKFFLYGYASNATMILMCLLLTSRSFDFTGWALYWAALTTVTAVLTLCMTVEFSLFDPDITMYKTFVLYACVLLNCVFLVITLQIILGGTVMQSRKDEYTMSAHMLYTATPGFIFLLFRLMRLVDLN
ncbi:hypothetical protein EVAR_34272_1 [Eumeta japonica]|uniref:Protein lifeguard 1 n=1 Tax=Eumeta variegata TaxID=151549 RepID=A0A4C1VVU3_EUMVA|nr:hypothetical protein EVAR_34272_1 [Eumeta japonica]